MTSNEQSNAGALFGLNVACAMISMAAALISFASMGRRLGWF